MSFRANKGETVAFIGATGSGKTTLVSLAARFYDATEGQVLIDGQDVRSYSFDALYDRIGYVTQRAIVFAGDVRSNVLFGESSAPQDDESVQRALSLAQATEFVDKLPGKRAQTSPAARSSAFPSRAHWPASRRSSSLMIRSPRWITAPMPASAPVWRAS